MPTVHVIDDDALVRESLVSLLRSVGIGVHAHAHPDSFLADPPGAEPCCLLLDVRLPGINGLDFQARLAGLGMELPVIVMTGYGDIPMSVRAMKAGAVDFLTKPFRDQDLLDAITSALDRDGARRARQDTMARHAAAYRTLTLRERQVMHLVTGGLMNKQVAFELGLSEITVKLYRAAAMRKMGARNIAEFVRIAEQLGIEREPARCSE